MLKTVVLRILCAVSIATLSACYSTTMLVDVEQTDVKDGVVQTPTGEFDFVKLNYQNLPAAQSSLAGASSIRQLIKPHYEYQIGSGDEVSVLLWAGQALVLSGGDQSGITQGRGLTDGMSSIPPQTVDKSGFIFIPYGGKVKVAGLTISQARARVDAALRKIYKNPQADLRVTRFQSRRFAVSGRVAAPGYYELDNTPKTIYDALRLASGVGDRSDISILRLSRKGQTYEIDVNQGNIAGVSLTQLYLQDGDVIHIPDAIEKRFYVLGEVGGNRSVPMLKQRYTLTEALTDAGGLNPITANVENIYVMRQDGLNRPKIYQLDATSATSMLLADRFYMAPRDIVYVDASKMAQFGRVASLLSGFFSTIQGVTGTAGVVTNPLNK